MLLLLGNFFLKNSHYLAYVESRGDRCPVGRGVVADVEGKWVMSHTETLPAWHVIIINAGEGRVAQWFLMNSGDFSGQLSKTDFIGGISLWETYETHCFCILGSN